jgi:hypothetical protein
MSEKRFVYSIVVEGSLFDVHLHLRKEDGWKKINDCYFTKICFLEDGTGLDGVYVTDYVHKGGAVRSVCADPRQADSTYNVLLEKVKKQEEKKE